jgi:hypothetical protein
LRTALAVTPVAFCVLDYGVLPPAGAFAMHMIHCCSTDMSLTVGCGSGLSAVLGGGMSCTTATRW